MNTRRAERHRGAAGGSAGIGADSAQQVIAGVGVQAETFARAEQTGHIGDTLGWAEKRTPVALRAPSARQIRATGQVPVCSTDTAARATRCRHEWRHGRQECVRHVRLAQRTASAGPFRVRPPGAMNCAPAFEREILKPVSRGAIYHARGRPTSAIISLCPVERVSLTAA